MPWTAGVDRATNYVVTATNWNDLLGATGSLMATTHVVGTNTAEQTTTAATPVDLVTVTPNVNITSSQGIRITLTYRKSAGSASNAYLGLKLNAIVVAEASAAAFVGRCSNVNQAEDGTCVIDIPPRATSYLAGLIARYRLVVSATRVNQDNASMLSNTLSADLPTADITSIVIRGDSIAGTQTLAVKDVKVEVY